MATTAAADRVKVYIAVMTWQFGYAVNHVIMRAALNMGVSQFVFPVYRNFVAVACLVPFAYFLEKNHRPRLTASLLIQFIVLGLIGVTLNQGFYLVGLIYTSPTFASAMENLIPAVTFIMAVALRIEQVDLNRTHGIAKVIGTTACVVGALTITLYKGPTIYAPNVTPNQSQLSFALEESERSGGDIHWTFGCLCHIGHCLCWSTWMVLQPGVLKKYPARISLTSFTFFFGAVLFLAIAAIFEGDSQAWHVHSGGELFSIVYAGSVASAMGFAIQIWVIAKEGPVFVSVYLPVQTLLVAIMASIVLGEEFFLGGIVGAVLIITGLYLVVWGKNEELKFSSENIIILSMPEKSEICVPEKSYLNESLLASSA
ncbi:hypothetical protein ACFE04_000631 [Oxalis oulophora]